MSATLEVADYICPKCKRVPEPSCFDYKYNFGDCGAVYKLGDDGKLVIPTVKMKALTCCNINRVVPFHKNKDDYCLAIASYMAFFAPVTPWIQDYFRNMKTQTKRAE